MPNTYRIQVITKDETEIGTYCDAQYLEMPSDMTLAEFQKQSESLVEDEKNKRIAAWVDSIKNPPAQAEPTKEDLIAEQAAILEQKAMLEARISEITDKVAQIDAAVDITPTDDVKGKIG